jgi:hypothetical protein
MAGTTSPRGWGVCCKDRSGARHLAIDEPEPPKHAVVAKEALTSAYHDGVDHQPELVDEVVREPQRDKLRAAEDEQVLARLAL